MSITTWVQGVATGLTVALAIWGMKQLFLRRQLSLVQPRLFNYSGLGGKGSSKTIELTIINAGKRAEEDVRVQFAPDFSYSIVASNASGLNINSEGVLVLDRIAPKQEITLIVIAEGGEFRREHILGLTSKDGVGAIKSTLQEAQTTPAQILAAIGIFTFIILPFGYGIGKVIEVTVWQEINDAIFGASVVASPTQKQQAPKIEVLEVREGEVQISQTSYGLKPQTQQNLASTIRVTSAHRQGDVATLQIQLTNNGPDRLVYNISVHSSVGEQRSKAKVSINYIESEIIVFSGSSKEISLEDYLPSSTAPQMLLLQAMIERGADRVWISKDISLKAAPPSKTVATP